MQSDGVDSGGYAVEFTGNEMASLMNCMQHALYALPDSEFEKSVGSSKKEVEAISHQFKVVYQGVVHDRWRSVDLDEVDEWGLKPGWSDRS